jgi:hypothetical protein
MLTYLDMADRMVPDGVEWGPGCALLAVYRGLSVNLCEKEGCQSTISPRSLYNKFKPLPCNWNKQPCIPVRITKT